MVPARAARIGRMLACGALALPVAACGAGTAARPAERGVVQLGSLPDQGPLPTPPAAAAPGPAAPAVAVAGAGTVQPGGAPIAVASAGAVREPPPAAPPPPAITFAFTGDTLAHTPIIDLARSYAGGAGYDFRPMLSRIAPIVGAADVAVCHLETPIAPPGQPLSTAPTYGVPTEIVDAIAASGYDRCSTASNHTFDRGAAGIDATVAAFQHAGIDQVGMASAPEQIQPRVVDAAGVRFTHLSYTFGFNGLPYPDGQTWRSAALDVPRILADAATARSMGAQIVIVSLHWGIEGSSEVTGDQRGVAQALTGSGLVDLIVGHHAHVLQPIEQVNGRWVVYGLGNILSNLGSIAKWPVDVEDGAIVTVRFEPQPDGSYAAQQPVVIPTWVDVPGGWLVRPVVADLADPSLAPATRARLQGSLDRTLAKLGPYVQLAA